MMRNILAIAKNTFRETMRDRIVLAACVVVGLMILFSLFIASISIDQDIRMITDFSLTAIYILQIFVAIFIGSMLIYKEIERKTFFLIIPKPVSVDEIIIGKCLGLTATTAVVSLISTFCLFIILLFKGGNIFFLPILLSVLLSIIESSILILLSILFSGITSPILSAVYTTGFFLIGHSSEIIRTILTQTTSTVKIFFLTTAYYLLPNLEKFNTRNDVVYGNIPDLKALVISVAYAVGYASIIFLIARTNLRKKEF